MGKTMLDCMALTECRRFPLLQQALIARSALEAAGLHPFVFDEHRASVLWTEQFALNGIRLMVPEEECALAEQIVGAADAVTLDEPVQPPRDRPWTSLALFALGVAIGWPIAGFRRPDVFHRATALVLTLITLWLWTALALRHGR